MAKVVFKGTVYVLLWELLEWQFILYSNHFHLVFM